MNSFKNIDLTQKKKLSFNPVKDETLILTSEAQKVNKPLNMEEQTFIDENIAQWRSTIKNNLQLQALIKVRFKEQLSLEWTEEHNEYLVNRVTQVI